MKKKKKKTTISGIIIFCYYNAVNMICLAKCVYELYNHVVLKINICG